MSSYINFKYELSNGIVLPSVEYQMHYNVTASPSLQTPPVLYKRHANVLNAGNFGTKMKRPRGIGFVHHVVKMQIGICKRCSR